MTLSIGQKIAANAEYQRKLGWTLSELGLVEQAAGAELVAAIQAEQQRLGFILAQCDGIAGPRTYRAALLATIARRNAELGAARFTMDTRGQVAVLAARADWCLDIRDLPAAQISVGSRTWIDATVRTHAGSNWTWEQPYRGNGDIEWCGMAVARFWASAGLRLDLRRNFLPSTYRLDRFARYQQATDTVPNPRPPAGPYRMIIELDENSTRANCVFPDGSIPREGDIMLVGGAKSSYGTHVTMIAGPVKPGDGRPGTDSYPTLEGNATGAGPSGARVHGVIKHARLIGLSSTAAPTTYHARRIIRFAPADLLAGVLHGA